MNPIAFQAALDSWHDFFLATGSASAALLGLLFVGISINLASISETERVDLRTKANLAFSNLLYLLGMSLIVLIPSSDAGTIAISFTVIAVLGLVRVPIWLLLVLERRRAVLACHSARVKSHRTRCQRLRGARIQRSNVVNLDGGMTAWTASGRQLVQVNRG